MTHAGTDGSSPFDERDGAHMACPSWMREDDAAVGVSPEAGEVGEPELDPPHHVHDLWVVLGLGEE